MTIILDFDGTCVTNDFPRIGKEIGAIPVLKRLQERGHKIVLFTARADDMDNEFFQGNFLTDAVNWFTENGIKLYGINNNPDNDDLGYTRKVTGDVVIDDMAIGAPLTTNHHISAKPFIDWDNVEYILDVMGYFEPTLYEHYGICDKCLSVDCKCNFSDFTKH